MILTKNIGNTYANNERIEARRRRVRCKVNKKDSKAKLSLYERKRLVTLPRIPLDVSANLVEQEETKGRAEVGTITAVFIPKEETPRRVVKSGIDAHTQIEEPELVFNFDEEVGPLVNIIVDKTIEQCLVELTQERQLFEVRQRLSTYRTHRQQSLSAKEDIEQKAIKSLKERERVYSEAVQRDTRLRRLAKIFSNYYERISTKGGIVDKAFQKLANVCILKLKQRQEIDDYVRETLIHRVSEHVEVSTTARVLTDELIQRVLLKYPRKSQPADIINIYLEGDGFFGSSRVGPIPLPSSAGVAEAERIVQQWVLENWDSTVMPPIGGYMRLAKGYFEASEDDENLSVKAESEPATGRTQQEDPSADTLSVPPAV